MARFEPFSTTEGLSNNRVPALFEDREGILWFGIDSALTKRGTSSFVRFDEADGFAPEMPVFGMAGTGTFVEEVVLPQEAAVKIDDDVPFEISYLICLSLLLVVYMLLGKHLQQLV